MAWTYEQQKRLEQIQAMSFAELIHLMITGHDGNRESTYPSSQSRDYFDAAEELDKRWEAINDKKDS